MARHLSELSIGTYRGIRELNDLFEELVKVFDNDEIK